MLSLPLCVDHADHVHQVVADDRAAMIAVVLARREERRAEAEVIIAKKRKGPELVRAEVIYYVQVGGHIKIGWTGQLEQRMRQYPPNSTLLAVHPGSRDDEKLLHRKFKVHLSHGKEWYPLVPVILDHIKRVIAEHGAPPDMTFGARPTEVRRPKDKPQLRAKYGPMLRS